ncbi:MAG: flagellar protein FlaG [Syntrophobacteraceae bacterium]|jgi:flagellar protein FlaG|nr:flagellar protein FlaG [Syntrophobacteraceae bacterium]
MEAKLREIQPIPAESWVRQNHDLNEPPLIQPPVRPNASGGTKAFSSERKPQDGNAPHGESGKTIRLVEEVQDYLDNLNIQLSFEIHEKTGEMVVQVMNRETGDLIRQLPPEELLDLKDKLSELRGVLFHQKA